MPNRNDGTDIGRSNRVWTLQDDEIGGAIVRMGFMNGARPMKAGDRLSGDEVRAIPTVNRRALSVGGKLDIFPKPLAGMAAVAEDLDRFVTHRGRGEYDVIEGRKLNEGPLTKDEAEKMAAA